MLITNTTTCLTVAGFVSNTSDQKYKEFLKTNQINENWIDQPLYFKDNVCVIGIIYLIV